MNGCSDRALCCLPVFFFFVPCSGFLRLREIIYIVSSKMDETETNALLRSIGRYLVTMVKVVYVYECMCFWVCVNETCHELVIYLKRLVLSLLKMADKWMNGWMVSISECGLKSSLLIMMMMMRYLGRYLKVLVKWQHTVFNQSISKSNQFSFVGSFFLSLICSNEYNF